MFTEKEKFIQTRDKLILAILNAAIALNIVDFIFKIAKGLNFIVNVLSFPNLFLGCLIAFCISRIYKYANASYEAISNLHDNNELKTTKNKPNQQTSIKSLVGLLLFYGILDSLSPTTSLFQAKEMTTLIIIVSVYLLFVELVRSKNNEPIVATSSEEVTPASNTSNNLANKMFSFEAFICGVNLKQQV